MSSTLLSITSSQNSNKDLICRASLNCSVKIPGTILLNFESRSQKGLLVCSEAEKINAFVMNGCGDYVPSEFASPFKNLHLSSFKQISAFKESLKTNGYVRIADVEEGHEKSFKVYFHSKLSGGGAPDEERDDLENARRFDELGISCSSEGRLDEALELFQKSFGIRDRYHPDGLELATSYSLIGSIYCKKGRFDEALEHYKKSLAISEARDASSLDVAKSCKVIGKIEQFQRNFDGALTHYKKSLKIYETQDADGRDTAEVCTRIGLVYLSQKKFSEVLEYLKRSLLIQERFDSESLEVAKLCNDIGQALHHLGSSDEALEYFGRGLAISKKQGVDNPDFNALYHNIGAVYYSKNNLGQAFEYYIKGLAIAKRTASNDQIAMFCNDIARVYQSQGEFEKSLEYYKQSLSIRESLGLNKQEIARLYNNIGLLQEALGMSDEALAHYKKGLAIAEGVDTNSIGVSTICMHIGRLYQSQGKLEDALELFQRSLVIREALSLTGLEVAVSYNYIGTVYKAKRKFEEALGFFLKAYPIQQRILTPKHPNLLFFTQALVQTSLELSSWNVAIEYSEKIIKNDPDYKFAHVSYALALKGQGKFDASLKAFDQALACDSGYGDAVIYRLELIVELAKKVGSFQGVSPEVAKALQVKKTDYDVKKKLELKQIAHVSNKLANADLPESKYEIDSKEYLKRIQEILLDMKEKANASGVEKVNFDVCLSIIEKRLGTLQLSQ